MLHADISKRLKFKATIEKDRASVKPTVINDTMIKTYQVRYNRENAIFDQDNLPIWHMTHLALSYKNIIEIDNLAGLE